MTEEQFWKANPRIISVWEKAHQEELKELNRLMHIQGFYINHAVSVAIGKAFCKNFKGEYMEEPIPIFELTETEKKAQKEKEIAKYVEWTKRIKPQ